jgi:hypothetical protein
MALLLVAPEFVRSLDEEAGLTAAAKALPDDWRVDIRGRVATGVFTMTISGNGIAVGYKLFAPTHVADAIRWLQSIKPPA